MHSPDLDREPRLPHPHESVGVRWRPGDRAIHADHRRVRMCNTIRTIAVIDVERLVDADVLCRAVSESVYDPGIQMLAAGKGKGKLDLLDRVTRHRCRVEAP